MTKVLITGGAGFIGSHLGQALLQQGIQVTVIDNLSTGTLDNIALLRQSSGFNFVRGDIRDGSLVQTLIKDCDYIYHLAAAVGVQLIAEDPVSTIATNIGGTEIVLEKANQFSKRIFLASTSEVYGKSEAVPFREDDNFILGSTSFSRWSYACSKAIDEFLGKAYYDQYGLPVVIGRFFNTVGPRQTGRYGMVIPRFVQWALRNEALQIYGTGQQSRCFCYVGDVVKALIQLMSHPQAPGQVFNIGSTEEIAINALAERIISRCGSKSTTEYLSYDEAYGRPIEDMMRRVPCIDRVSRLINWQPQTQLDDILDSVIAYERQRHSLD